MKYFSKHVMSFLLAASFVSGCSYGPSTYANVEITNRTIASPVKLDLSLSRQDLSAIPDPSYRLKDSYGSMNCFVLVFGNAATVPEAVTGSYRYYSEKSRPMELVYQKGNTAVFVPREKIQTKPPVPLEPSLSTELKFGKYILEIQYELNGQKYSSEFDVKYLKNYKSEFHGIWELKNVS